ncbi:hypothetical protein HYH03_016294 [Edaphochlamys debaryana]|uniref:NYN domain-containing protein n=1 Tax=Edaphochlamys debaryana TaxID=47281 RepID=A0A835XIW9_9CHLO|nr:hypothetical protein HYH03_016294 [Edaphochlamys debaryana]|eukprot:KAG2484908.1 hypothetical protein HYH03_016294 [Edaphochlamys debaryana]
MRRARSTPTRHIQRSSLWRCPRGLLPSLHAGSTSPQHAGSTPSGSSLASNRSRGPLAGAGLSPPGPAAAASGPTPGPDGGGAGGGFVRWGDESTAALTALLRGRRVALLWDVDNVDFWAPRDSAPLQLRRLRNLVERCGGRVEMCRTYGNQATARRLAGVLPLLPRCGLARAVVVAVRPDAADMELAADAEAFALGSGCGSASESGSRSGSGSADPCAATAADDSRRTAAGAAAAAGPGGPGGAAVVVVSQDTDFALPLRRLSEAGVATLVLSPHRPTHKTHVIMEPATYFRRLPLPAACCMALKWEPLPAALTAEETAWAAGLGLGLGLDLGPTAGAWAGPAAGADLGLEMDPRPRHPAVRAEAQAQAAAEKGPGAGMRRSTGGAAAVVEAGAGRARPGPDTETMEEAGVEAGVEAEGVGAGVFQGGGRASVRGCVTRLWVNPTPWPASVEAWGPGGVEGAGVRAGAGEEGTGTGGKAAGRARMMAGRRRGR